MKTLIRPWRRSTAFALAAVLLLLGCGSRRHKGEPAYVSAPQAVLRDRVAAIYNNAGTVKNADRVEILDRDRRFALVRTASGTQGWLEQRYLVTQKVFDGFQKLAQESHDLPDQAAAVTRNETNLHLEPGRDTDHLYLVAQGAKLILLKRSTTEKRLPGMKPPAPDASKPMEDWWLVRDAAGHAGWALGRLLDVDVPLEVGQYAEGQRIIASLVLNEVQDGDKKVPQYLVLLNEPKDGQPTDYNQFRVYTWNVKRHRYETAYRERIAGDLPVTLSQEDFGKEGILPAFVLHTTDDHGNVADRKYKLNTPIVRRVDDAAAADHSASANRH